MAPPPAKRAKLLSGVSFGSASDSESDNGVQLPETGFSINEDYAKRFEHNKKREERERLEEKFKSSKASATTLREDDESDESTDESEDDDAELATETLDQEIEATLQAIKKKDPRVYDQNVTFYRDWEDETGEVRKEKKEKPMYLQDYHRQQLMAGQAGGQSDDEAEEEIDAPVRTYQQEQDALRRDVVGQMHGVTGEDEDAPDDDDDFMVAKSKPKHNLLPTTETKVNRDRAKQITDVEIKDADRDPETYLSNFMTSRAWLPKGSSAWGPAFDSDDSDDERRADAFEEAYNMRFEDPAAANEKLKSFARDAAAKSSVRRDEKTGRVKKRDREREAKEAEREERRREKERLKVLRMDEVGEKVQRIREAAGLKKGEELDLDQWRDVLEGDFSDDAWDAEMKRRFGEQYYAERDEGIEVEEDDSGDEGDGEATGKKKKSSKKPKKPTWGDEIDINDLVPDFDDDAKNEKPDFTLSDSDGEGARLHAEDEGMDVDGDAQEGKKKSKAKSKKERNKEDMLARRTKRKERQQIESIVDASLPLSHPELAVGPSKIIQDDQPAAGGFRYRETSPTSFGLSARDILFATDADLNQYAGLKKMAAFRDEEKKRRDKKRFSKKARLRQWRKETFGKTDEPVGGFEVILGRGEKAEGDGKRRGGEGAGKKRKRGGKGKKEENGGRKREVEAVA